MLYNGGPTATMALLPGSAAIDVGNSFGVSTDQRGGRRPFDKAIANATGGDGSDIGAFEVGGLVRFLAITRFRNDIRVALTTDLGNNYNLQRRDNVASGTWTTIFNNIAGTGAVIDKTHTNGAAILPKGFYRVQSLP